MTPMINEVPELPITGLAFIFLTLAVACSVADAAVRRITRTEAAEAMADQVRGGSRIAYIVSHRSAARAGLQVAKTVLDLLAGMCIALLGADILGAWWQVMLAGATIAIVLAVTLAMSTPIGLARAKPVAILSLLSGPLNWLTRVFAIFISHVEEEGEPSDDDDLSVMVERVSESEELEDDERQLLQSVFELSQTMVREVMVPRPDMVTVEESDSLEDAVTAFVRSGFSRIPVMGENLDDVSGIIFLKDVVRRMHRRLDTDDMTVNDLMRDPVFVPEMKPVDDLLHDMQAESFHLALVVDEYGGIAGLVTIEDLLEELVGDMVDEHDRAEPEATEIEPGIFRVPARLPIDELGELFGLDIEDDDVDTAGGLLTKGLERLPIPGARTEIMGMSLTAERFEGRRKRLATLLAQKLPEESHD